MMLSSLFQDAQAVQFIRGFHPGMLSGLALTGANRTPQPGQDDGILMADEIAFLPLDGVDLVVLSACETGLGPTAGGEGLLGVQRAFQVAGARTTIASLWNVDDVATAALMRLFYHKLWSEKKSPLDALRESQLAIYHHPEKIKYLSTMRGPKFDTVVEVVAKPPRNRQTRTASPKLWAAFVLSGDWR